MIHILVGNDTKEKNAYIKDLVKGCEVIFLPESPNNKDLLNNYAQNISLFGESPVVKVENILCQGEITFSPDELLFLKDSPTVFIFSEDKMLAVEEKRYKKYADIEYFEKKEVKQVPKVNTFAIADAFARKDKIGTWILYNEAIEAGTEPEAISGMLFWKIKTMILNGVKTFPLSELKHQSSEIVSLYHKAHRGECDFVVGLEQFILSSLTK